MGEHIFPMIDLSACSIQIAITLSFFINFWLCVFIYGSANCYIVGRRAFQICFEQTLPDAATFLHSSLQVAYLRCACDDHRILCWYVIPWHVSCRFFFSPFFPSLLWQFTILVRTFQFMIVNTFAETSIFLVQQIPQTLSF